MRGYSIVANVHRPRDTWSQPELIGSIDTIIQNILPMLFITLPLLASIININHYTSVDVPSSGILSHLVFEIIFIIVLGYTFSCN